MSTPTSNQTSSPISVNKQDTVPALNPDQAHSVTEITKGEQRIQNLKNHIVPNYDNVPPLEKNPDFVAYELPKGNKDIDKLSRRQRQQLQINQYKNKKGPNSQVKSQIYIPKNNGSQKNQTNRGAAKASQIQSSQVGDFEKRLGGFDSQVQTSMKLLEDKLENTVADIAQAIKDSNPKPPKPPGYVVPGSLAYFGKKTSWKTENYHVLKLSFGPMLKTLAYASVIKYAKKNIFSIDSLVELTRSWTQEGGLIREMIFSPLYLTTRLVQLQMWLMKNKSTPSTPWYHWSRIIPTSVNGLANAAIIGSLMTILAVAFIKIKYSQFEHFLEYRKKSTISVPALATDDRRPDSLSLNEIKHYDPVIMSCTIHHRTNIKQLNRLIFYLELIKYIKPKTQHISIELASQLYSIRECTLSLDKSALLVRLQSTAKNLHTMNEDRLLSLKSQFLRANTVNFVYQTFLRYRTKHLQDFQLPLLQ